MTEQEIQLTREERLAIEPILQEMSKAAKHSISLDALLTQWGQFVIQVEQGYSLTIYDYTNDLSVRNLIERIREKAPQSLQTKLDQALQIWDDRFMQATRPLNRLLRIPGSPDSWQRYRIPKNPGEELRRDLEAENL